MRNSFLALSRVLLLPLTTSAEVTSVTITSQTIVAGGQSFGSTGHNPGLEELVEQLTGEGQDLPTAALAHIVLEIDQWRDLRLSTRGTLLGHWRPKELT